MAPFGKILLGVTLAWLVFVWICSTAATVNPGAVILYGVVMVPVISGIIWLYATIWIMEPDPKKPQQP